MDKIKVAICDDAPYVIDCLKMKMDWPEIEVTGISYSALDCINMLSSANADVLLIDIQMETPTAGIDIIPSVKSAFPNLKIIMLTSFDDENYIFKAFSQGADNYILKSFDIDICKTIKDTFYNKTAFFTL